MMLPPQGDPSPGANAWGLHLQWPARLEVTQASVPARQPLLALRRRIAAIAGHPEVAGGAWLQHAKLCRSAGGAHMNAIHSPDYRLLL